MSYNEEAKWGTDTTVEFVLPMDCTLVGIGNCAVFNSTIELRERGYERRTDCSSSCLIEIIPSVCTVPKFTTVADAFTGASSAGAEGGVKSIRVPPPLTVKLPTM
jgi:hypothetical protein